MEIPIRNAKIEAMKAKKDGSYQLEKIEREGKAILDLQKPISDLKAPELELLLFWYGKPKSSQGLKPAKVASWTKIVADNTPPPSYEKWTPENEAELEQLKTMDISMGDTAFGRLLGVRKRELHAAVDHYDRGERAELKRKLDIMDANEETQDGEEGAA